MKRAWRGFALRALLSAGLFTLLLSRVRWRELSALLRGVHPGPFVLGSLLLAACPLLFAARTRLLLGQWRIALPYPTVLALTWVGQFCNAFLPGSTGGDAVKFLRLCRLAPARKTASFAALLADRLVALLALVLLAGGALVFGDHHLWREILAGSSARIGSRGMLVVCGVALGMTLLLALLWVARQARVSTWIARGRGTLATFLSGCRPSAALGGALLLAITVHLLSLAGCYLFCRALQIPISFLQVMLVWPVTTLAVLLPLTVNGHGLREYILLFYFQRWHLVSALAGGSRITETVVALSLLMVMTDLVWSLPGGLCLLYTGRVASPVAAFSPKLCSNNDTRSIMASI